MGCTSFILLCKSPFVAFSQKQSTNYKAFSCIPQLIKSRQHDLFTVYVSMFLSKNGILETRVHYWQKKYLESTSETLVNIYNYF